MKFKNAILIACLLIAGACNKNGGGQHEHESHDSGEGGPNQELYDRVMDVHDEVMPKMNDLYKTKTELSTRLKLPGITDSERDEIKQKIARIDSANDAMMVWMRQFEPPADSVGADSARAYLEAELVKVKQVKEDIQAALENATAH